MIVCIAEKPSVARDIADVLGAREKKDGYIEGNGYQVTWTFGQHPQMLTVCFSNRHDPIQPGRSR